MSTIRFGVQWAPALTGQELASFCKELEDLGYYSVGFPDHYFVGFPDHYFVGKGPDYMPLHEPFTALGYVAGVTSSIRLVSIVADNDFRHPALFARSAASVDVLSDGRVEAGIGAGWFAPEYAAIGASFDAPSIRIERLEEAVTIIKSLWTQDRTDFEGVHYRIKDAPGLPKPVQKPHPPLLIGAGGPKMLALAGRHADVVGLTSSLRNFDDRASILKEMSRDSIARKIETVRRSAQDAGRSEDDVILQMQLDKIEFEGDDPGHLWAITGEPSVMIDELHSRQEIGISYYMLRERRIERIREFAEKVVNKL